jgi:hypothetical protein
MNTEDSIIDKVSTEIDKKSKRIKESSADIATDICNNARKIINNEINKLPSVLKPSEVGTVDINNLKESIYKKLDDLATKKCIDASLKYDLVFDGNLDEWGGQKNKVSKISSTPSQ